MPVVQTKRRKESNKDILLALVQKRGERFSAALLDHIEDTVLGRLLDESANSPKASEESVMNILRGNREPRKKRKAVNASEHFEAMKDAKDPEVLKRGDAELIKIMDGIPGSPAVSREQVFKTLRGEK